MHGPRATGSAGRFGRCAGVASFSRRRLAWLAAFIAAGAGCSSGGGNADNGSGGDDADPVDALPSLYFWLHASAEGQSGEFTVECGLDYIVELGDEVSRTDAAVEYLGTMGGEARRSLLRGDGSGVAFIADAFSEVQVLLTFPNRVQINMINLPPDPPGVSSRFWSEQRRLEGSVIGERIFGDWTCAPLDTVVNGINDNSIVLPGTWLTEEILN